MHQSESRFTERVVKISVGNLSLELLHAYLKTDYLVHDKGAEFILKVSQRSNQLNCLYEQSNTISVAYKTAYNPSSTLVPEKENAVLSLVSPKQGDGLNGI